MKSRIAIICALSAANGVLGTLVWQAAMAPQPAPQPLDLSTCDTTPSYDIGCDVEAPAGFNEAIQSAADEFGVDPWVLAATAYRESDCRPGVTGAAGEIGMFQVHPRWWSDALKSEGIIKSDSDLYNMETNIRAGAWIFSNIQRRVGDDIWTMFRTYNGSGPAARAYATAQVAALNTYSYGAF